MCIRDSYIGEVFKMEQTVTEMPMDITNEYITLVKPQGFLRYWYRSLYSGPDVDDEYKVRVTRCDYFMAKFWLFLGSNGDIFFGYF